MTTGSKANVPSPWRKDLTNKGNCSLNSGKLCNGYQELFQKGQRQRFCSRKGCMSSGALSRVREPREEASSRECTGGQHQLHRTTTGPWPLLLSQYFSTSTQDHEGNAETSKITMDWGHIWNNVFFWVPLLKIITNIKVIQTKTCWGPRSGG